MSDLISRCRTAAKDCYLFNRTESSVYGKIYDEAADKIEQLQKQLETANNIIHKYRYGKSQEQKP